MTCHGEHFRSTYCAARRKWDLQKQPTDQSKLREELAKIRARKLEQKAEGELRHAFVGGGAGET